MPKICYVGEKGSGDPALLEKLSEKFPGCVVEYLDPGEYRGYGEKMLAIVAVDDVVVVPHDDVQRYIGFLTHGTRNTLVAAGFPDLGIIMSVEIL